MHHANLIVGSVEACLSAIPKEDRQLGTDVLQYAFKRFGIDEARRLKQEATLRPLQRPYRTFIVVLDSITTEAQNALLKLFEDPDAAIRFYIIVPQEDMLIPTLRSRLMRLEGGTEAAEITEPARHFLGSSYAERLTMIAERTKEKDDVWICAVLDGIEVAVERERDQMAMRELLLVRQYEKWRGASKKMLLEHLALSLHIQGTEN
jgi:DNA polymerase III delta prime subunit